MNKRLKTLLGLASVFVVILSFLSCATPNFNAGQGITVKQVMPVMRGNLTNSVAVDGNLVMPLAFDLKFGAPGNVLDVMVEKGDYVKAGMILATLDYYSQQLDIQSANCDLQQTLSNLYETIPSIQQTYGYPSFYPNAAASLAAGWADEEVSLAHELFVMNLYSEATSELRLASADLAACSRIFRDAIENPYCGLGDTSAFDNRDETTSWMQYYPTDRVTMVQQWQGIIDTLKGSQSDLDRAQELISTGGTAEAGALIGRLTAQLNGVSIKVADNVNRIRVQQYNTIYPGRDLCLFFYDAAEAKLDGALDIIDAGTLGSDY